MAEDKILPPPEKDNQSDDIKYDVSHAPTPHVVKVNKSPTKLYFTLLLIFVLLVGNVYLGYMYYQEKENAKKMQQQIDASKSQASNQAEETTNINEVADVISYTAEVGKFTLTLPNKYVIIRTIDGKGEGGEATYLNIGTTTDYQGVVDDGTTVGVSGYKIVSDPKVKFGDGFTIQEYIASVLQDQNDQKTSKENIKVDGVNSLYYSVDGFGYDEYVFFETNRNFYYISSIGVSSQENNTLDDIIEGFKFN